MKIVVQEWERVLLYRDGHFEEALGAGRHRRSRRRRSWIRVVVRPRPLVVSSQEVLTADGLSVKVSLTAVVRTSDPRRWHETVEDADSFVYGALQIALREAVAARTLDELLAARGSLPDDVLAGAGQRRTTSAWSSSAFRSAT
ncbi:SPFH domain-containing protein [Blastococcus sp. TF02-9]|uniref:SPFH domain-containing protein n=1 Tax=Blastococcus sp. TF02-09 TaxID=2250576 RepID=UPI00131480D9|nr:SPFH domain-containing protein [Blastococcus sp. TF02-9]